jgi:hemoglobin
MQTVYEAAGGADGLLRLANAWHARVMADGGQPRVQPRVPSRAQPAARRLLGGVARWPNDVFNCYGDETSVVRMHSGNGPHQEMDRRGVALYCWPSSLATGRHL